MAAKREQVVPGGSSLERPSIGGNRYLAENDPELGKSVQDVLGALRQDILPVDVQEQLFHGMNAAVQRNLIAEASGLDAGILVMFKQQLSLVDAILRRTFNSDGTLATTGNEEAALAMDPKDVLNLSLKVSQMMVRELPKVYNMDRVQKMETALLKVMSEHLTRDQQNAFLQELDNQKNAL